MKIDVNHVVKMQRELIILNSAKLDSLELMDGDTPIEISQEKKDAFKITGLCNFDFILAACPEKGLSRVNAMENSDEDEVDESNTIPSRKVKG